jgi:regulator of cell morphogenesis and NO signaling
MNLDSSRTVRDIAVEHPNATRVFEKLGIDYCCGGGKSLADACSAARLSADEVVRALESELAARADAAADWSNGELASLAQHIINKHHNYVRNELPRLEQLMAKVASVHGARHAELLDIQKELHQLGGELMTHMMKEEHILFPYIAEMEQTVQSGRRLRPPMFGTVRNPVQMMIMEHDAAGDEMRRMRQASSGYTAPADACISYQTLYRALQEFEADLHQHIHLENNILFPRAVGME